MHLFCQVFFISNQDQGKGRLCVLVDALNPLPDTCKRLLISFVEHNDDSVSLSVHLVSQVTESILTCGIPDLDVDLLLRICFRFKLPVYVVHPNGANGFLVELLLVELFCH